MQTTAALSQSIETRNGNDSKFGVRACRAAVDVLETSVTVTEACHVLRERFGYVIGPAELAEAFADLSWPKPRQFVGRRLARRPATGLLAQCFADCDRRLRRSKRSR